MSFRAFSCDVIAAMLEDKNNTFSLPWEIRSIFMQNCFIVSALQHGRRENPLYDPMPLLPQTLQRRMATCLPLSCKLNSHVNRRPYPRLLLGKRNNERNMSLSLNFFCPIRKSNNGSFHLKGWNFPLKAEAFYLMVIVKHKMLHAVVRRDV